MVLHVLLVVEVALPALSFLRDLGQGEAAETWTRPLRWMGSRRRRGCRGGSTARCGHPRGRRCFELAVLIGHGQAHGRLEVGRPLELNIGGERLAQSACEQVDLVLRRELLAVGQ